MQWGLPILTQVTAQDLPATSRGWSITFSLAGARVVGISLASNLGKPISTLT